MFKNKKSKFIKRQKKVRGLILETKKYPRLSVFRSNKHIYAQIIDDVKGRTISAVSDKMFSLDKKNNVGKIALAGLVGEEVAKRSIKKKISKVIFDKSGYKYHGRVRAVAEGARKGGLKF